MLTLPAACATAPIDAPRWCPPVADYRAEDAETIAVAVEGLPSGSPLVTVLGDYAVLRDNARACAAPRR